jgi:hypothetical protein
MPGVFDHLSAQLNNDDNNEPGGLSAIDLADLPSDQKKIMLTMLRDPASAFDGVPAAVLTEKLKDTVLTLNETLAQLVSQTWLISLGEPPNVRYRLNLRAKRGSTSKYNLWTVLSDRLPENWKGSIKPDAT